MACGREGGETLAFDHDGIDWLYTRPVVQVTSLSTLDVRVVRDGYDPKPTEFFAAGVPEPELGRAFAGLVDERGDVVLPYNCLLVRVASEVVLIDCGLGSYSPGAGRLEQALAAEGVEPDAVTIVLLTHAHPDHIGGLTVAGQPRFLGARHVITGKEWEFWGSALAGGSLPPGLATPLEEQLAPIEQRGMLELVASDAEVLPGLCLVPAAGHTPGHVAVSIGFGDKTLLYLADAVIHPLHFEHMSWSTIGDHDLHLMAETRERLLGLAADEHLRVAASHVWQPGRVSRSGAAFRFLPDSG
jgi:glyoxylase-like metal-dependent hydrolase (beta-lactamase superfamily II)